jgi:hypothetical protein
MGELRHLRLLKEVDSHGPELEARFGPRPELKAGPDAKLPRRPDRHAAQLSRLHETVASVPKPPRRRADPRKVRMFRSFKLIGHGKQLWSVDQQKLLPRSRRPQSVVN